MGCIPECWDSWQASQPATYDHLWQVQETGRGVWELGESKCLPKKVQEVSSKSSRRKTQGATGQSDLPQSLMEDDRLPYSGGCLSPQRWQEGDQDSCHGFTKGKLCWTILIVFYSKTTTRMNEGRSVDIVHLDLRLLTLSLTASSQANLGNVGLMRGQGGGLRKGWMTDPRGL